MLKLCDVGPRDGLQNEAEALEPATRAELVNKLAAAGLPRVEAVSFVRDDRVPQMARAEEVVAGIERRDGTEYSGLVLNEQGYERFAQTGLDRVNATLGATEEFNRRNGNASLDEAVARVQRILAEAQQPATVTISVAFGCPFEGRVDPGAVVDLAARFDAVEVVLADTIGVAAPREVKGLVSATTRETPAMRTPSPRSRRGRRSWTPPSAASAAARTRRARAATSRPRTSSTCSSTRASRPASTSTC